MSAAERLVWSPAAWEEYPLVSLIRADFFADTGGGSPVSISPQQSWLYLNDSWLVYVTVGTPWSFVAWGIVYPYVSVLHGIRECLDNRCLPGFLG